MSHLGKRHLPDSEEETNSEGYRDKIIIKLLDRVEALEEKIPRMEFEHHNKMRTIESEMGGKFEKLENEYKEKMEAIAEKAEVETIRMIQRYKRALADNCHFLKMSADVIDKQADMLGVLKKDGNTMVDQRAVWSLDGTTRELTNELRGYCSNGYGIAGGEKRMPPLPTPQMGQQQPYVPPPWPPGALSNFAPPHWHHNNNNLQYYLAPPPPPPPPPSAPLMSLELSPPPPPPPEEEEDEIPIPPNYH